LEPAFKKKMEQEEGEGDALRTRNMGKKKSKRRTNVTSEEKERGEGGTLNYRNRSGGCRGSRRHRQWGSSTWGRRKGGIALKALNGNTLLQGEKKRRPSRFSFRALHDTKAPASFFPRGMGTQQERKGSRISWEVGKMRGSN